MRLRKCSKGAPAISTDRLFRTAFVSALIFATVMALVPRPPELGAEVGDKVRHMLAFGTLAILAAGGWPRAPLFRIGERLSFLGAMIEVAQSIPALRRDCNIWDWVADTGAILAVLLVVWGWRNTFGSRAAPR